MPEGITKYIIAIAIILVLAVLSQQIYFRELGKSLISNATEPAAVYLTKGFASVGGAVLPSISGQVKNGGDMIQNAVNPEKISENVGQKISNYFSGVENAIVHPGAPQNCQPTQTTSAQP